jgi:hypothetical protein
VITGTSRGFRIYHTDPFAKIFSSDDGNVALIEMLFSTSLVALILSPRHLVIQNTKVRKYWNFALERSFMSSRRPESADADLEIINHLRAYIPICRSCS